MQEVGESNTGLIIAPDGKRFMAAHGGKSGKKVTSRPPNNPMQNRWMLMRARASADQPMWSRRGPPVIVNGLPIELTKDMETEEQVREVSSQLGVKVLDGVLEAMEDLELIEEVFGKELKPPPWKHATYVKLIAHYYQRALDDSGGKLSACRAIHINLSSNLVRKADASDKGFLDYVRRAFVRELKRKLKRTPDLWLALECTIKGDWHGKPHIHGAIVATKEELPAIRAAVRTINGKINEEFDARFRNHEFRSQLIYSGCGVARYATKHTGSTRLFIPNGEILTATQPVIRRARKLYEEDRQFIISNAMRCH